MCSSVQVKLRHPVHEDLSFLYGTILTDGKDSFSDEPTANMCVFADAQVGEFIKQSIHIFVFYLNIMLRKRAIRESMILVVTAKQKKDETQT